MQLMEFACPICKGPLQHGSTGYFCTGDQRGYRMTVGIPDFRLLPDQSFESEMEHGDYRARAGVLCAIAWGTIMAPARLLAFATPLPLIMEAMQTAVWLVMLAFLLYHASIALPARFMPHQLVLSDPSG